MNRPAASMTSSTSAASAASAAVMLSLLILGNKAFPSAAFTPSYSPSSSFTIPIHHRTLSRHQEYDDNSFNAPTTALFSSKPKLSRPQRKALERETKQRKKEEQQQQQGGGGNNHNYNKKSRRKHNYKERATFLSTEDDNGGYNLHSNRISTLTQDSTADDVIKAIKRAQNLHDAHDLRIIETFLIEEVDESFGYGYRGSLLARLAVAALHMNEYDIAKKAIDERRLKHKLALIPMSSAAIIRGLLRVHNVADAMKILDDELPLPEPGTTLDDPEVKEILKHRALSLGSVSSRHFFEGEPSMAVLACNMLSELGPILRSSGLTAEELKFPWTRIIQGASQCESGRREGTVIPCMEDVVLPCNLVYSVLNAMSTFPSDNNDRTYEALSNALVRRTLFITGAINMDGCPDSDRGEVVFIGRSNVGKSSLVNMITNRKSLAYTSKRPGKTQQFNYFAVNDKPGREKEIRYGDVVEGEKDADSFYIVDVPGFGFAKVPEKQKQEWSSFLTDYVSNRHTLKVLFHLIDARHGPLEEDTNIMAKIGETLPKGVKYVVVLTKADKNVKGPSSQNSGKVSKSVLHKVREAMKANGVGNAPTILTSAQTKLGRDSIWRYMNLAAEA